MDHKIVVSELPSTVASSGNPRRRGAYLIGCVYMITITIGPGALTLPWALSYLGWSLGSLAMHAFSVAAICTVILQMKSTRCDGDTYMDTVRDHLGGLHVLVLVVIRGVNIFITSIGFSIATSGRMKEIRVSNCLRGKVDSSSCKFSNNPFLIIFGAVQIVLSQISDFDGIMRWFPAVAAVMPFIYFPIGLGLQFQKLAENGRSSGSWTGARNGTILQSLRAVGAIAFVYSTTFSLNEIKDIIKPEVTENKKMGKAGLVIAVATSVFKIFCAFSGYAAFGDESPENLLAYSGFQNRYWLVEIANAAVVIHLVIAYQIICQPLFAAVENTVQKWFPGFRKLNLFRFFWRTIFVIISVSISMYVPSFNDVVGILGALRFWPLTVYYPMEIYIRRKKIGRWSWKWIGLQTVSVACLIVTVAAAVGSFAGLVSLL